MIGVNTAIRKGAAGICFAIPADTVADIVPELLAYGQSIAQHSGSVCGRTAHRERPGVPRLVVIGTRPTSAGTFESGDILLGVAGYAVHSAFDLTRVLRRNMINARIPVSVWRKGKEVVVDCVPTRLVQRDS